MKKSSIETDWKFSNSRIAWWTRGVVLVALLGLIYLWWDDHKLSFREIAPICAFIVVSMILISLYVRPK